MDNNWGKIVNSYHIETGSSCWVEAKEKLSKFIIKFNNKTHLLRETQSGIWRWFRYYECNLVRRLNHSNRMQRTLWFFQGSFIALQVGNGKLAETDGFSQEKHQSLRKQMKTIQRRLQYSMNAIPFQYRYRNERVCSV